MHASIVAMLQEKAALVAEVERMKRTTRATRVSELEAEVHALQDEIHRQMAMQRTLGKRMKQMEGSTDGAPVTSSKPRSTLSPTRTPLHAPCMHACMHATLNGCTMWYRWLHVLPHTFETLVLTAPALHRYRSWCCVHVAMTRLVNGVADS
jgi:hypothetical protein